jgi:hypothetical protein
LAGFEVITEAISRAQILAVIVASPKLERTQCIRLEQMPLINVFCRAVHESSQSVAFGGVGERVA